MKIRKIGFENHPLFANLQLDFTDKNGNSVDTIIIAGENGVGKSLLLNTIFEFSRNHTDRNKRDEKRFFEIELTDAENELLKTDSNTSSFMSGESVRNVLSVTIDFNIGNNWNQIKFERYAKNAKFHLAGNYFHQGSNITILRTIFSDVEINFTPHQINSVTARNIDISNNQSTKSTSNLANDITQLLIDVQSLDALEFTEWARENKGQVIDEVKIDSRMKRFTNAFDFMFPSKKYKKIGNKDDRKQILFEENGREMEISELSSGEKQIVFRGSFLLKDRESSKGALILIDEPEISLHPTWQLKILSFFKKLFTNPEGEQTSQIIISTHSPFIIHNFNRENDKVIILKKDAGGKTIVLDEPTFFGWSSEKIVEEAFNVSSLLSASKILVLVAGETDEKYFNKAIEVFGKPTTDIEIKWIGRINENGGVENTGDSALNNAKAFFTANMDMVKDGAVLLYDCDTNKPEEDIQRLRIRIMEHNLNNKLYKKGVENLLELPDNFNGEKYYSINTNPDGYGGGSTVKKLDKMRLCNDICDKMDIEDQKKFLRNIEMELDKLFDIK